MQKALKKLVDADVYKLIISNPTEKSNQFRKIVIEKKKNGYQSSKYTEKQVFHDNISAHSLFDYLNDTVLFKYKQINAWSESTEHILLVSKKGACNYKTKKTEATVSASTENNRQKNYILEEGSVVEPLVDMGIFTPEGKIIKAMYSKYKQINRFLEIIDDEISSSGKKEFNIIDFGCGKSYLTFILYHYFTNIAKIKVNMIGLDLKEDVIEKCNVAAKKYRYNDLRFELGDINGYKAPFDVDMVISLHACNTATDHALYNAINWNAKYIFSVPCCQHELNDQIEPNELSILSRYGIVKERFCALATDAIRGNLLEYCGYKTQLLEFVDLDHTPKNILIRAVKRQTTPKQTKENALNEINALIKEFSFEPTLYKLIFEQNG
jgi:SAM-dependent methyltransferase